MRFADASEEETVGAEADADQEEKASTDWQTFTDKLAIRLAEGDPVRCYQIEEMNLPLRIAFGCIGYRLEQQKAIARAQGYSEDESEGKDFSGYALAKGLHPNLVHVSEDEIEERKRRDLRWCTTCDAWRFKCRCRN